MADASTTWLRLHGSENWAGLLHPLDPSLRAEITKYGRFAQATYDAFDDAGPSCGSCRYDAGCLLDEVGLGKSGYEVTKYLYATMVELPRLPWPLTLLRKVWLKQLLRIDSWSEDCNWMGYVAVSGDEESRRLGRRDILVAWRGTMEPSEWFKDAQWVLESLKTGGGSGAAMVERGFQSIYTSNSRRARFTRSSASEQMKEEIRRLLNTYCKEDGKEEVSLTVTGHSLGGALALLCAHDAAASIPAGLSHVSVITFGAPHVGDAAFVDELAEKGVKVLRVVNKEDEVPKGLGSLDDRYQHAGVELELDMGDQARGWQLEVVAAHKLKMYLHLVEPAPVPGPASRS